MKSNFEDLQEFHKSFEHPCPDEVDNKFFEKKSLVKLRMDLIREEVKELEDAVINKDFIETVDALGDIIYVVQGMSVCMGVDLQKAFDIIHSSNMSKLCKTEEEAKQTVAWYMKNKLDTYDSPTYKQSKDKKYYIVYNSSTGKILKNINYTSANFSSIFT